MIKYDKKWCKKSKLWYFLVLATERKVLGSNPHERTKVTAYCSLFLLCGDSNEFALTLIDLTFFINFVFEISYWFKFFHKLKFTIHCRDYFFSCV